MVRVKEIAFMGYPVTDLARARAFYEQTLGLRAVAVSEHEGRFWIEYEIGASTLVISNMSPDQWKPSSDGPSAALEVMDFADAVAALRAAGTRFLVGPIDSGLCHMAIVTDPDGNSLCIHQRYRK